MRRETPAPCDNAVPLAAKSASAAPCGVGTGERAFRQPSAWPLAIIYHDFPLLALRHEIVGDLRAFCTPAVAMAGPDELASAVSVHDLLLLNPLAFSYPPPRPTVWAGCRTSTLVTNRPLAPSSSSNAETMMASQMRSMFCNRQSRARCVSPT